MTPKTPPLKGGRVRQLADEGDDLMD